jgi:ABC-type glutathione transport system ATPase component
MKLKLSRRTGTIIKLALAAAVVVVIAYRLRFAPVPVLGHEICPGSIAGEVMGTGTLEARVKTTISPRIQERLAEVLVDQNDRVETGQLLARLDDVAPRAARQRAMELLDYLGVADRAANLPDALSGGQQQRVAAARALANHPSLILADEPSAALDSQRGRQVMDLFRKVAHEQGAGVIVVTHDQRSLDVFDRTFEMEDGHLKSRQEPDGSIAKDSPHHN